MISKAIRNASLLNLKVLLLIGIGLTLLLSSSSNAAVMEDYCIVPPYVSRGSIPPNILPVVDNAEIMGKQAYDVIPPAVDVYDPAKTYDGLFQPALYYSYPSNRWEPDNGTTSDPDGNNLPGAFLGNLMNWVGMSQYDLLEVVLVGGISRSRQTNVNTLVSKSNTNWTKELITNTPNPGDKCIFNKNGENITITESVNGACSLLDSPPTKVVYNQEQIDKTTAVASLSFIERVKNMGKRFVNFITDTFPSKAYAALAPVIQTSSPLPQAIQGVAYTATISAKWGKTPFTWSVSLGSLPLALVLDPVGVGNNKDTTISGTATDLIGIYFFDITITDFAGNFDTKTFQLEIVAAGGAGSPRISQNYNLWICAGDNNINCNNAGAQVIDPTTGLYPPPCSPYETSRCSLKYGLVQDFWDDARWAFQDFQRTDNPIIEKCLDSNMSNPVEGSTPDSDYLTAVENASFISDGTGVTFLVDAEYRSMEYFLANATQPGCGNKDPFENDTTACRKNFVLMITAGEGADNPPDPNIADIPNVFPDSDCDPYSSNLAKNACYGNINDLRSATLGKDDKPGTQNVYTYVVNAFGTDPAKQIILKQASAAGGGSGPIDGSGVPDSYSQYYDASGGTELKKELKKAIRDMLARASSGTAASVLASGEGYGANLIQAIFYPTLAFPNPVTLSDDEIQWIGRLTNFWFYVDPFFTASSIYEDNSSSKVLDLTDDNRVSFFFDTVIEQTMASREVDSDGDGIPDTVLPNVKFEDLTSLWGAGKLLWERDISTDARTIYTPLNTGLPLTNNANKFYTANVAGLRPLLNTDDAARSGAENDTVATNVIKYIHGEEILDYTDAVGTESYRTRTVYVDGAGPYVWKLGDVLNSTPRISSWIQLNTYDSRYNDQTYTNFIESIGDYCSSTTSTSCTVDADCPPAETCIGSNTDYKGRGMVFAGANDGGLHAFKLGSLEMEWAGQTDYQHARLSGTDLGKEMWAFTPKNALPYLKYFKEPDYCHVYTVDLAPRLFDVSIGATGPAVAGCTDANYQDCLKTGVADPGDRWRTVLIGGMRFGGASRESDDATCTDCVKAPGVELQGEGGAGVDTIAEKTLGFSSYFALDITDQNNPTLLWEFSGDLTGNPATSNYLGFATTGPAIVRIGDNPNENGKWFVVFGSGPTGPIDKTDQQFMGRSDQNLKLFIFDLKQGPAGPDGVTVIDTGITNAFAGSMLNATQDTDVEYQDDVLYIPYVTKCAATTTYCTVDTWTNGGIGRLLTKEDPDPGNWVWSKAIENIGTVTSGVSRLQHVSKGQLWLYFGTGRFYYKSGADVDDPTTERQIFGMKDPCFSTAGFDLTCSDSDIVSFGALDDVTNIAAANALDPDATKGWYISLDIEGDYTYDEGNPPVTITKNYKAERMITDPLTTPSGLALFTTFKPYTDQCSLGGKSALWAVKYNTGGAAGALLKGVALLQVSTGSIEQIDLPDAFTEAGGRKTTAIEGVPPTSQGLSLLSTPPPIKRTMHIRER